MLIKPLLALVKDELVGGLAVLLQFDDANKKPKLEKQKLRTTYSHVSKHLHTV